MISFVFSLNSLCRSFSYPLFDSSCTSGSPGVSEYANLKTCSRRGCCSGLALYLESTPKICLQTVSKLVVGQIGFSPNLPSYFMYRSLVGSILWPSPPTLGRPRPLFWVEEKVAPLGSSACLFFMWVYMAG